MMTSMDADDEMTAQEFDRLLASGRQVELDVRLRADRQPLYTLTVSSGGGRAGTTGGFDRMIQVSSPAVVLQSA